MFCIFSTLWDYSSELVVLESFRMGEIITTDCTSIVLYVRYLFLHFFIYYSKFIKRPLNLFFYFQILYYWFRWSVIDQFVININLINLLRKLQWVVCFISSEKETMTFTVVQRIRCIGSKIQANDETSVSCYR